MKALWLLFVLLVITIPCVAQSSYSYVLASGSPSGGESVGVQTPQSQPIVTPYKGGLSGYGGGAAGEVSAVCSGQTTWVFNWNGPTGSVPPDNVIVAVTSSASYNIPSGSGACDNGYHDTPFNVGGTGWVSLGTHYIIYHNPKTSFTLQLTPSSSAYAATGEGTCTVNIKMSVTNVTLSIKGGLYPGLSSDECMTGQYQVASFSAGSYIPSGAVYDWSVTGAGTPQSAPTWGSNHSEHIWNPITYPVNTTSSSQTFFDNASGQETATCSTTAVDPNGNQIGAISGHYNMQVLYPSYAFTQATHSYSYLNTTPLGYPTSIVSAEPGDQGFTIRYSATTPSNLASTEGYGSVMPVQLINWDSKVNDVGGVTFSTETNGYELDNTFPMFAPLPANGNSDFTGDTPELGLNGVATQSVTVDGLFHMFNVYQPPAVSGVPAPEYIPLDMQNWTWITSDEGSSFPWPSPTGDPAIGSVVDPSINLFTWSEVFTNVP